MKETFLLARFLPLDGWHISCRWTLCNPLHILCFILERFGASAALRLCFLHYSGVREGGFKERPWTGISGIYIFRARHRRASEIYRYRVILSVVFLSSLSSSPCRLFRRPCHPFIDTSCPPVTGMRRVLKFKGRQKRYFPRQ
jgi:hypothetical protein